MESGLVEVVYLSHEHVRAAQFLTILGDKIRETKPRRLVLDSVTHIARDILPPEELRELLYKLALLFKTHDVTSLLTFESKTLYATGEITERGFSPVADNIFLLRYQPGRGGLRPTLLIVKTRGSAHDRGTHWFDMGTGGVRIGGRTAEEPQSDAPAAPRPRRRGAPQPKKKSKKAPARR
jgi:circadian clock protein KaiC